MNKEEFLAELKESLQGEVAEPVIRDTLAYYQDYIQNEVRTGKKEEDIINMLGSGRIIAKTVIEANAGAGGDTGSYASGTGDEQGKEYHAQRESTGLSWKTKAKGIAVLIAVLVVVIVLAGLVLHIIWALLPIVLLIAVIYAIVKRFF